MYHNRLLLGIYLQIYLYKLIGIKSQFNNLNLSFLSNPWFNFDLSNSNFVGKIYELKLHHIKTDAIISGGFSY